MIYVLNTPVLTNYGIYRFSKISPEEAREILEKNNFTSAVGHQATAEVMTQLLDVEIPCNRIKVEMKKGDIAIVFRLLQRLPEGKVLNREELKSLPFELGLLERID